MPAFVEKQQWTKDLVCKILTEDHIASKKTIVHTIAIRISEGILIKDHVKQALIQYFEEWLLKIKAI